MADMLGSFRSVVGQRSISIAPSGALTQVRSSSPGWPCTRPVRRSRTCPVRSRPDAAVADAHAAAEGQRRARALAGREDRLLAVARGLDAARAEADRARRSPRSPSPTTLVRLEVLEVQARRIALALRSALSSTPAARPGRTGTSPARASRGRARRAAPGRRRPCCAAVALVQPVAGPALGRAREAPRRRSPCSASARAVDVHHVAQLAARGRGRAACS